jgi:hypothetical protein
MSEYPPKYQNIFFSSYNYPTYLSTVPTTGKMFFSNKNILIKKLVFDFQAYIIWNEIEMMYKQLTMSNKN